MSYMQRVAWSFFKQLIFCSWSELWADRPKKGLGSPGQNVGFQQTPPLGCVSLGAQHGSEGTEAILQMRKGHEYLGN